MFELSDFFHLPEIDELIDQMASAAPGLMVIAGPDARQAQGFSAGAGFLSSGRSALFQILVEKCLARLPGKKCIVVAGDKSAIRTPRALKSRVTLSIVDEAFSYEERLAAAISFRPGLVALDRLQPGNLRMALKAASAGLPVLAQLDSVCWGADVLLRLQDMGASAQELERVAWIVFVQRIEKLCERCKEPFTPEAAFWEALEGRFPALRKAGGESAQVFYRPGSCEHCQGSGRRGDVALFDIYRAQPGAFTPLSRPSLLPLETYLWRLAELGHLSPQDALDFHAGQLNRTFQLLSEREEALKSATAAFERKLAELEVANRVLQQRTQSLISLQEIGQAMITSQNLSALASRVCRRAGELCGADRAVLYYLRTPEEAEVLAVGGWEHLPVHKKLDPKSVFLLGSIKEPATFKGLPPGALSRQPDEEEPDLKSGLYVPLVANDRLVGLMIVHSTHKPLFTQGEVALLQGFANQAALAIERAGLVEQLQAKIAQLEAAQRGLRIKERMERELELAREVQQSVLPRLFPEVPGFHFAARNIPARQVGGDFYDVIPLDEGRFGLAIADVSDKGMPAALYMALTRSLLLAEARRPENRSAPRQVLFSINQLLQELGQPKLFVTLFYGVIDRRSRLLTYACAGHDRPVLLRDGAARFLEGQGGPLGILPADELRISEERLQLQPGDRLGLYTDGLVDLLAPDGRAVGRERLMTLFRENAHLPAQALCEGLFSALEAYRAGAEQYDDMALLVLEVDRSQENSSKNLTNSSA